MAFWTEMYVHPYAPHGPVIIGLKVDGSEVRCRFNAVRQQWEDDAGSRVVITHWREIGRSVAI